MTQSLRVYYSLSERPFLAGSVMTFLLFGAAQCVAFFNTHLVFYGGYPQLLLRYITLTATRFFSGGVLPWVSGVLFLCSVGYAILSLIDADGDGQLSVAELKQYFGMGS